MRDHPPLNALVAFEAVARTGSVALAAEELFVTPGAVSKQLRVLDDFFEISLFERQGRGLMLSARGAIYFDQIAPHLAGIRRASKGLLDDGRRSIIRMHSYTTFATRWLIPRLSVFQITHPLIEVRLTTSSDWSAKTDCDAVIRLGSGQWPGYEATKLVNNVLILVCSPSLVQRSRPVDKVWLAEQTLLQVSSRPSDWDTWCLADSIDPLAMARRRIFESSAVAYEAAMDGLGVIVAQKILVEQELASGQLIEPFDRRVDREDETYYLVIENARRCRQALIELREELGAS